MVALHSSAPIYELLVVSAVFLNLILPFGVEDDRPLHPVAVGEVSEYKVMIINDGRDMLELVDDLIDDFIVRFEVVLDDSLEVDLIGNIVVGDSFEEGVNVVPKKGAIHLLAAHQQLK